VKRWLVHSIAWLLALAALLAIGLWVRSYWWRDWVVYACPDAYLASSGSANGVVFVSVTDDAMAWPPADAAVKWRQSEAVPDNTPTFGYKARYMPDDMRAKLLQYFQREINARRNKPTTRTAKEEGELKMFEGQHRDTTRQPRSQYTVFFPTGLFMILALPLAIVGTRDILRARRVRKLERMGLCAKCGYDLRASKDRCPECGRAIEPDNPGIAKAACPSDTHHV